jgi:hypothetical protein
LHRRFVATTESKVGGRVAPRCSLGNIYRDLCTILRELGIGLVPCSLLGKESASLAERLPGGTGAVGDRVPVVDRLAHAFENVVSTRDWHPAGHASFASSYAGAKPALETHRAFAILRKGPNAMVDSYSAFSAFAEADGRTMGLAALLRARGIEHRQRYRLYVNYFRSALSDSCNKA